jgi:hypothetical protein
MLRASFCSLLLADPKRGNPISVAAQAGHSARMLFDRYAAVIAELEDTESRDAEIVISEAREQARRTDVRVTKM